MEADGHATTSRALLEQARHELAADDVLQASEKLWGAAAHTVKAVAEKRGWPHNGHRQLMEVVNRLANETGDSDFRALFAIAQNLHINFYEVTWPREFVEDGIGAVEKLIAKMEAIPTSGPRP